MSIRQRHKLTGSALSSAVAQWTQAGFIKSIQQGTVTLSNVNTNTATLTTSVVPANSVIVYVGLASNGAGGSVAGGPGMARVTLTDATTVTATRSNGAGSGDVTTAGFVVIECVPGVIKSVQRGTVTIASGALSNTDTLSTPVNTLKSFLVWVGQSNDSDGGSNYGDYANRLTLTNATTVTSTRGTTGAYAIVSGYQVVELY